MTQQSFLLVRVEPDLHHSRKAAFDLELAEPIEWLADANGHNAGVWWNLPIGRGACLATCASRRGTPEIP
jgi:hypothetical protein